VSHADLFDVGNDTLSVAVTLVGDGGTGPGVVQAQVGSLVDTVTVRFVGETTSLRLDRPGDKAKLDASRQHVITFVATDDTDFEAPEAQITLELIDPPPNALLSSGTRSSMTSLTVVTDRRGQATAYLRSEPGLVTVRATGGSATLTVEFRLYGEPSTLRLLPIDGPAIEAGTETSSILAILLDEQDQGVPNHRVVLSADRGLVVTSEGDGESQMTDDEGTARFHLDSRNAELGPANVRAAWRLGERSLDDELEIRVTGPPAALYLRAEVTDAEVEEMLIEEYAPSSRYRLYADVLDELGQHVAGSYQVRWRPVISEAKAQIYPQISMTQRGVATAIFDLQHIDGEPQPDATWAQAFLIRKAQVNNNGLISDLLGEGLALLARENYLIWRGPETTISEVVAEISHTVESAWRVTEDGVWQAWFTAEVPGAVDFTLEAGDSFQLDLISAAMLQNVERYQLVSVVQ